MNRFSASTADMINLFNGSFIVGDIPVIKMKHLPETIKDSFYLGKHVDDTTLLG